MKQQVATFVLTAVLKLLSLLPLRSVRKFAGFIALCLKWTRSTPFQTTQQNLTHCFSDLSDAERSTFTMERLRHFACEFLELGFLWNWRVDRIEELIVAVHGEAQLKRDLQSHPIIALVPHFGFWEVGTYYFGSRHRATILYSARRLGPLTDRVIRARARFGSSFVDSSVQGLRRLMTDIGEGRITVVLPDQVPIQGRSELVGFFGKPAQTTTLVHGLIERSQARVYVFTFMRVRDGYEIFIDPAESEIYSEELAVSVQGMNSSIETAVRRDLPQYQWEYKRFRRVPNQDIYQSNSN